MIGLRIAPRIARVIAPPLTISNPATLATPYIAAAAGFGVELWHSLLDVPTSAGKVINWRGQMLGTLLQSTSVPTRPTYGADGTTFGSKSVVQCNGASGWLLASGLSTFLASGSRPCVFVRARYRSASADATLVDFGVTGISDDLDLKLGPAGAALDYYGSGTTVTCSNGIDAIVRSHSAWADGTNKNLKVSSQLNQAVSAAGLGHNISEIAIGRAASGVYHLGVHSTALIFVLSSYPGATIMANIDAIATAEFPP